MYGDTIMPYDDKGRIAQEVVTNNEEFIDIINALKTLNCNIISIKKCLTDGRFEIQYVEDGSIELGTLNVKDYSSAMRMLHR